MTKFRPKKCTLPCRIVSWEKKTTGGRRGIGSGGAGEDGTPGKRAIEELEELGDQAEVGGRRVGVVGVPERVKLKKK